MMFLYKVLSRLSTVNCLLITNRRSFANYKMVVSKNILLAARFQGEPKESDFQLVEEELPPLKDGEFCAEALFWSVDPYMRAYVTRDNTPPGTVMFGGQIARVIESKNPDYKVGDHVHGQFGWRTHTIYNPSTGSKELGLRSYKLPDFHGLPLSLGLGVLGMPGNTAYFGLLEICNPKEGETVVVSGAAGAVGSLVGQIAKIKGCRVIGFAGSDDKVKWLKEELKYDYAYNYKTTDLRKALKESAPNGVDCYFDNVGGDISATVMSFMNLFGRISVCGCISSYNDQRPPQSMIVQPFMVSKQLKMEGFIVSRWAERWLEGIQQNAKWIKEGKLKYRETVTEGFENMPKAFIGMLRGENTGKAVVKANL